MEYAGLKQLAIFNYGTSAGGQVSQMEAICLFYVIMSSFVY